MPIARRKSWSTRKREKAARSKPPKKKADPDHGEDQVTIPAYPLPDGSCRSCCSTFRRFHLPPGASHVRFAIAAIDDFQRSRRFYPPATGTMKVSSSPAWISVAHPSKRQDVSPVYEKNGTIDEGTVGRRQIVPAAPRPGSMRARKDILQRGSKRAPGRSPASAGPRRRSMLTMIFMGLPDQPVISSFRDIVPPQGGLGGDARRIPSLAGIKIVDHPVEILLADALSLARSVGQRLVEGPIGKRSRPPG